jgi:transposase-like protein
MRDIRMTTKELKKIEMLALVSKGEMKMAEGARKLGMTKRHLRRLRRVYEKEGGEGIAHKARGRKSRNAFSEKLEEEIAKLLHHRYSDFGPTFAAEKIREDLGRNVSKEKIRQLQIKEGLWKAKKKKEKRYHPRRKRRSRKGELVQIDGSDHDWLEGRGERMSLILFIDDATSEIPLGEFVKAETTKDYMRLTRDYIEENGLPEALYSDKHSIFRQNQKEGYLKGDLTQYGVALKEVGIELICAHSPQAKGRVERSFGTHQDRLVKEMRLAGIETLEEANKYLKKYLVRHNKKFGVAPLSKENAHKEKQANLDKIFAIREKRVLSKGLSFQYKNVLYQLKNPREPNRLQNQRINVLEKLNGDLLVETQEGESLEVIPYKEYTGEVQKTLDAKEIGVSWASKRKVKPKRKHPWR